MSKDYTECEAAPDGKHKPDPSQIWPADGAGRNRGTDWIIDVACMYCGQTGSVRIDPNEITWE